MENIFTHIANSMNGNLIDVIGLFICLSGYVIGLGAVTVIDIHGFLGRKSHYWTEATTRTHKVTKPMIWAGIFLVSIGSALLYRDIPYTRIPLIQSIIIFILLLNGFFLSFKVSPYMIQREKEGKQAELLPVEWQRKIMAGLILSDIGWWSSIALLSWFLIFYR